MSTPPKTIATLGPETSVDYAKRQRLVDTTFVQDSKLIPQKVEIIPVTPYVPSEFEALFSVASKTTWAIFDPPPTSAPSPTLFTYQVAPSLGEMDAQDEQMEKLESLKDLWEKEGDSKDPQREKKRKAIEKLLQCVGNLDHMLSMANSRRSQYQKG